jgi:hypothetical protein
MSRGNAVTGGVPTSEELSKEELHLLAEHGSNELTRALGLVLLYRKDERLDKLKELVGDSRGDSS